MRDYSISGAWLVLAGAALWGTTGTAQALAPDAATPISVGTLRLLLGGAALLAWAWWRGHLGDPRTWHRLPLISGSVAVAAYQLCFFAGVDLTGVAVGTVVGIGSAPVLAGLLGWFIRGEVLTRRWIIATALAVLGCAILVLAGDDIGVDLLGIVLAIGAGGCYAIYALASKYLLDDHTPDAVMAWVFGLGALLLVPLLLFTDSNWAFEPAGLLVVAHLGIITVMLSYALFGRGLQSIPSSTAVTLSLAEPLTAGILGVVVLGERLTLPALGGIVLLFAGLWWLARD